MVRLRISFRDRQGGTHDQSLSIVFYFLNAVGKLGSRADDKKFPLFLRQRILNQIQSKKNSPVIRQYVIFS